MREGSGPTCPSPHCPLSKISAAAPAVPWRCSVPVGRSYFRQGGKTIRTAGATGNVMLNAHAKASGATSRTRGNAMTYEFVDVKHTGRITVVTLNPPRRHERLAQARPFRIARGVQRVCRRSRSMGGDRHRRRRSRVLRRQRPEVAGGGRRARLEFERFWRADDAVPLRQADHRRGQWRGDGRRVRDGAGLRSDHCVGERRLRAAGAARRPCGARRRPASAAPPDRIEARHGHDPDRPARLGARRP